MERRTEEMLARSLTAKDVRLIPYLAYLLQDLWELGSAAKEVFGLIRKHIPQITEMKILDLACGKGAVGVPLAKEFNVKVKMVDIIPEFVEFAKDKAVEFGVENLCEFSVEDISDTVKKERDWDGVMLLGVGNVLGDPAETVVKLKEVIKPGGYIFIGEVYLEDKENLNLKYEDDYLTYDQWLTVFEEAGLKLLGKMENDPEELTEENDYNNEVIQRRAEELKTAHPELKDLFDGYVQSQLDESYDVENTVACTTWLLQRN